MKSGSGFKFFIFTLVIFGSQGTKEGPCLAEADFQAKYGPQLGNITLKSAFNNSKIFLGSGSFGIVRQIDWTEDGRTSAFAVKQVIARVATRLPIIEKEMRTMQDLKSVDGVIQMKDCLVMEEQFPGGTKVGKRVVTDAFNSPVIYAVLEKLHASFEPLPKLGSASPLEKMKTGRPLNKLRVYLGIAKALASLHSKGYVHSDVKPGNIMAEDEDLQAVKLIDLGFSGKAGSAFRGSSPLFSSFEALTAQTLDLPMDIYSFGVTVAAIEFSIRNIELLGRQAFVSKQMAELVELASGFVKEHVPKVEGFGSLLGDEDNFSKIVVDCVKLDPGDRPTAGQLVARIAAYIAAVETAEKEERSAHPDPIVDSLDSAPGIFSRTAKKTSRLFKKLDAGEDEEPDRAVSEKRLKNRAVGIIEENRTPSSTVEVIVADVGVVFGVLIILFGIDFLMRKWFLPSNSTTE